MFVCVCFFSLGCFAQQLFLLFPPHAQSRPTSAIICDDPFLADAAVLPKFDKSSLLDVLAAIEALERAKEEEERARKEKEDDEDDDDAK